MTNESHLTMCVRHYVEYEINFSVDLLTTPCCLSSARFCRFSVFCQLVAPLLRRPRHSGTLFATFSTWTSLAYAH